MAKTNRTIKALKEALKRINQLDPSDYSYDEDDRAAIEGAARMKDAVLAEVEYLIDSFEMSLN